jgi:hypothetical protein
MLDQGKLLCITLFQQTVTMLDQGKLLCITLFQQTVTMLDQGKLLCSTLLDFIRLTHKLRYFHNLPQTSLSTIYQQHFISVPI